MYLYLLTFLSLFNSLLHADLYTIWAHGIVDKPSQVKRFQQAIVTDQEHTKSVAFPDTQKETGYGINRLICEITNQAGKTVNRSKMCMSETDDIKTAKHSLSSIPTEHDIILYGCSRGGATLLNLIAQENPQNITALILDAAPAYMPGAIHPIMAQLGIPIKYDATIFTTLFPAYPKDAVGPLARIKHIINKNLPILIIHSQDDTKVPYLHALKLYHEFNHQEFKNVYLVSIPKGKHAFLLQDSNAQAAYLQAIHSFYKKYKLPFDSQWAQNDLNQYQPSIDSIENEISKLENTNQKQYQESIWRNIIIAASTIALCLSYAWYKQSNL